MLTVHTFELAGDVHEIVFNARARYLFEDISGYPTTKLKAWEDFDHPSDREMAQLLTAGLEGARVRSARAGVRGTRRTAWTVDDVIDVIGDADRDEQMEVFTVCLRAVVAALKGVDGADSAEATEAPDGEGKAPPTG